jgi:hypothetical protein
MGIDEVCSEVFFGVSGAEGIGFRRVFVRWGNGASTAVAVTAGTIFPVCGATKDLLFVPFAVPFASVTVFFS